MTFDQVKTKMMQTVSSFFAVGKVYYAEQKMSEPVEPYITLRFGSIKNHQHSVDEYKSNGEVEKNNYLSCDVELNLFTNGQNIGGDVYANTALGDLMDFIYYIQSDKIIDDLMGSDLYVEYVDGTAKDLSGIINETIYRYRAYAVLRVFYTDTVKGVYNQKGKTVPNSSSGGKQEYVDAADEWFNQVVIEEAENE